MNNVQTPIVWSISGSDCSGGAGIQADLKTAYALGLELCTLSTANTSQNNQYFEAMNPTDVHVLQEQLLVLLETTPPQVIKIGLLANNEQVSWLIDTLFALTQTYEDLVVVLDPVYKATVQDKPQAELSFSLLKQLYSIVDIITPNYDEALQLASYLDSHWQDNPAEQVVLAQFLQAKFNASIIVKGGHISNKSGQKTDVCVQGTAVYQVTTNQVNTRFTHGTGCSFATAISCFLAKGLSLKDALVHAKAFIQKGLSLSEGKLHQYGAFQQPNFPIEKSYYPQVNPQNTLTLNQQPFATLCCEKPGLYPVVGTLEWLAKLLPLGLKIIQLRLKEIPIQKISGLVKQAVQLANKFDTRLFINDYWQAAVEHGAYGVHLGQEDLEALSETELNTLQASGIRLGLSSHGIFEYRLAAQYQPSYIAMGAIFPTQTKDMTGQIQGVQELAIVNALKEEIPLVAIGGITQQNITAVANTGVSSIAVVTAITLADDYTKAVKDLQASMR